MKSFIAVLSVVALMVGIAGAQGLSERQQRRRELREELRAKALDRIEVVLNANEVGLNEECVLPPKACGHWQDVETVCTRKGYFTTEYDVCRNPGYFVSRDEEECIAEERCEKIPVPPQFKTEIDCMGKEIKIMTVCPSFREVKHPAQYRTKCCKTWVKGTCKVTPRQVWHEGKTETKVDRIWVND